MANLFGRKQGSASFYFLKTWEHRGDEMQGGVSKGARMHFEIRSPDK